MKFLVIGGAGYIGSHMVKQLLGAGHELVVADNFSTGYRSALLGGTLVELDIADAQALDALFASHHFDAVFHFASFIQVGESVTEPAKYYQNNLAATLTLLKAMVRAGVKRFIFSSTAAVYGDPQYVPIDEAHPKAAINPYGRTKWMVEQMLEDFDRAYGLKSVCLRYFNAAGADPDGQLGERHEPETHLLPLILQAASGRRKTITVYGFDYDTPDGTCIRDYVHVCDLVAAHALAVDYLLAGGSSTAFNLGNGQGFSVQQVIDTARRVTGRDIYISEASRRAGDPPRLVADASRANTLLAWRPQYARLEQIVAHAWEWERKYPWH
ncbi:UDP-glucose 4-epimerase GalE [Pseudomonas sp. V98_8]|jgi:UDP-glucose 4-epimerase|uniref:UDP-glucose 4-epimerase GalE n=1 Tax=unclassified Pseudomonas TaxID=196821 RepID=UPI001660D8BF|nr:MULTISPECIES: UDP-glucose 4-epimerase GalE [unclassified Pseudomonas]MBD0681005.1 UDP-glucose 4-epimerase GalE [Pseudomonas sp. PSB11]MDI3392418.1 UDP-glucose 4-epimerase GalE [Pseudomonas sp. V98_8]